MTLGKRLAQLRGKNKKQEEVADDLGIARSTYGAYEQDKREPDNSMLIKLSDYYDVSVDYLLGKTSEKNEDEINISFRDGGENISEEEAEYLEQQLKQFRELRKKFQQGK